MLLNPTINHRPLRPTRLILTAIIAFALIGTVVAPAESASASGSFSTAPTPTITGTLSLGSTLTAHPGTWSPAATSYGYQWFANGSKIALATHGTFAITASQVGKTISVAVAGHRSGYTSVARTSMSTAVVPSAHFPLTPAPRIQGTLASGSALHAHVGDWGTTGVTFSYQWKSGGVFIGGATSGDYVPTSSDIGKSILVSVTGKKAGYLSVKKYSVGTAVVPTPVVTGTVAAQTQQMSQSNLNSTQIGTFSVGQVLTLACYQRGESVKGFFSSSFGNGGWDNLWYRVSDGTYVADVDLETGTLDPVVAACADQPVADTTNAQVMATTQRMSSDTLNSTQSGSYVAGSRLTLTCYAYGEAVQGYFSGSFPSGYDSLWYTVNDGYWVADIDIQTGSNDPVTPACAPTTTPPAGNDELTRAKSWLDAHVPYNQGASYTNQYGTYREDCSGFVSMALGLPSSYTTVTLPQVMHPITKDELQPGDFMLNTASGDNGHVAIFMGWTDASHSHYVSWEENGMAGDAFEQTVPYPYWPSWAGSTNYNPYRRN